MQRIIICIGFVLLMANSFGVYGCGSSDLLDEVGQRYIRDISFSDADEDGTLTIDTFLDNCSDDPTEFDPEIFTDTFADISISVSSNAPGISLESYSIAYMPLGSADGMGNVALPPELANIPDGYYTVDIPSGSARTFPLTLLTFDTKMEFALKYPGFAARYRLRLVLHFVDEFGEDRDITFERTALFSNYNNC